MKIFKHLKWRDYLLIVFIIGLTYSRVYFELAIPDLMADIIDVIIKKGDKNTIIESGVKMLFFSSLVLLAVFLLSFFSATIASRFAANLRSSLYEKVQSFSMEEINKFSIPSLITRTTNDIQQVERMILQVFRMLLRAPFIIIGAILKIWSRSLQLTSVVIVAVFLIIIIVVIIFAKVGPKFKVIQKNIDDLNQVTRENLTGLKVIRAYNGEQHQENKFEEVNDKLTKTNIYVNRVLMIMQPMMYTMFNLTSLAVVWIGAFLISKGSIGLPTLVAFTQYAVQIVISFMMVTIGLIMIPRAVVSIKRINEVLETTSKITNPLNKEKLDQEKIEIEFKDVCFQYPEAQNCVLEKINLKINFGERVGFIGSTGSGKSTLINLITRFYDVTEGELLINNKNIKNYNIEELYDLIGYVPQKAVLFSGDISTNMRLGKKEIEENKILEALESAELLDFVYKQESKLNYKISQEGKNLSGGQKQRLSIARAIAREPLIYIFDDSLSALDNKTDLKVRKNLEKITKKATTLIVSQRIGTIIDCDKIVVLDEGKIVDIGKHDELVKKCLVYKQLVKSQLPLEAQ